MNEEEMKAQKAAEEKQATEQKAEGKEPDAKTDEAEANKGGDAPKEKLPREIFYERIRAGRPEGKYDEDEDEYFRNASSMMDELETKGKSYDDMINKILGRFKEDPDQAAAFLDYLDGMPLPMAIRKNMGDDALTMKEGDDGWDDFVAAVKERNQRMKESMAFAEELKSNGEKSDAAIAEFAKENGMSEEEVKDFTESILALVTEFGRGNVSKDFLGQWKHSRDYEKDVASAREQGRIDGKNEKINIEKKRMEGSGLPNGNAGGSTSEEVDAKTTKNSTADFLQKMRRV